MEKVRAFNWPKLLDVILLLIEFHIALNMRRYTSVPVDR